MYIHYCNLNSVDGQKENGEAEGGNAESPPAADGNEDMREEGDAAEHDAEDMDHGSSICTIGLIAKFARFFRLCFRFFPSDSFGDIILGSNSESRPRGSRMFGGINTLTSPLCGGIGSGDETGVFSLRALLISSSHKLFKFNGSLILPPRRNFVGRTILSFLP